MTDTAAARPNHDGRRSCLIAAATRSDVAAPAITRRGRLPRVGHTSFRAFVEVFGVIYTTNAIGATVSGKAIKTEGRFPDEEAAKKAHLLGINAVLGWTRTRDWTTAPLAFLRFF